MAMPLTTFSLAFAKTSSIESHVWTAGNLWANVDSVTERIGRAIDAHRSPFNERNSGNGVEGKSAPDHRHAEVLDWEGAKGVADTPSSTLRLALHVLTGAGFGSGTTSTRQVLQQVSPAIAWSYRDALKLFLGACSDDSCCVGYCNYLHS